ncbi:hypothetical protein F4553_002273 [Allocatelliglobosispora scoriae]|uniref:Uncharacterized protein n=1 Tax=Allocatelliglobosispora scoriae TaxID=643052 RepID=A0A841BKT5_9ACTN|nr:hypothetical protein [Allocatelliglobosispora scoriae]
MTHLEKLVVDRFAAAFEAVAGERVDPVVRRSQHADFQVDGPCRWPADSPGRLATSPPTCCRGPTSPA